MGHIIPEFPCLFDKARYGNITEMLRIGRKGLSSLSEYDIIQPHMKKYKIL